MELKNLKKLLKNLVPQCPSALVTSKKVAFTLAEVLITLGIIGIVAAVTMPTLVAKYEKRVTVERLKKIYSALNQAIRMAQVDFGDMEEWDFPQSATKASGKEFFDKYFRPYMAVYECGETRKVCQSLLPRHAVGYIFNDSTVFTMQIANKYAYIIVDINGDSKPNSDGRDVFRMSMSPGRGIYMFGNFGESGGEYSRDALINGVPVNNGTETACCARTCETSVYKKYTCGALIEHDGWQIKDDYPW